MRCRSLREDYGIEDANEMLSEPGTSAGTRPATTSPEVERVIR